MRKKFWFGLSLVLTGCAPLEFSDSIDSAYDFERTLFEKGRLEPRLVLGTSTQIYLYGRESFDGWTFEVEDEGVLLVQQVIVDPDGSDYIELSVEAVGTGATYLVAVNPAGVVKGEARVEVALPNRVELMAAGPLLAGLGDREAFTDSPQILAGGMATFEVHYWRDEQRLFGNAAVEGTGSGDLEVEVVTTWLGEDRDWVQIQTGEAGRQALSLRAAGVKFEQVPIDVVPPEAIASVDLIVESEKGAKQGEDLVILAQAWDDRDEPIYGVEYAWDRNGIGEGGVGDLYRYDYDRRDPGHMVAHWEDLEADVDIHGEGYVDSSNDLGCATVPGTTFAGAGLAALLLRRGRPRRATGARSTSW